MTRNRLLALLAVQLLALGVFAQSDEFGRASGGSIDVLTKAPRQFSGSLSLSQSNGGSGYGGTVGGKLLDDRLWFFASASVLPNIQFSTPDLKGVDLKATAQPVDWTTVSASYSQLQQPVLGTALPSSFLSLRSTSILSERATLNFSFTKSDSRRAP